MKKFFFWIFIILSILFFKDKEAFLKKIYDIKNTIFPKTFQPVTACRFSKKFPFSAMEYTRHAQCRMRCRNISEQMVQQTYEYGTVNCKKSNYQNVEPGKCPSYAIEKQHDFIFDSFRYGYGDRYQKTVSNRVRIIVGDCHHAPVLITVMNLDNEFQRCQCSGD